MLRWFSRVIFTEMKKYIFLLLACTALLLSFIYQTTAKNDSAEANKAFLYLNKVRANPAAFSKEIGANLSAVTKKPALKWNDTLARIARTKAMDMVNRNYTGHITPEGYGINYMMDTAGYKMPKEWLKDPKMNTFESWQAGAESGEALIRALILDTYDKNLSHRTQLLGMNDWNSKMVDIGIAFVQSPDAKYKTHSIIIIARHSW